MSDRPAVSDRVEWEARRLRRLAARAGLPDLSMWDVAEAIARASGRADRTPLTVYRALLDLAGVDHRAPDGFGTSAP